MRILVAGQTMPWPSLNGGRMRLANVIKALHELGDVDVFVASQEEAPPLDPDHDLVRRIALGRQPDPSPSLAARLRWYLNPELPLQFVDRDFSGLRETFAEFIRKVRYDLVWVSRISVFMALNGAMPTAPTIVDIDDLRGDWIATQLAANGSDDGRLNPIRRLRQLPVRRNASMWEELQTQVASSVAAVVVCSEEDRKRLDLTNAQVVPNGYDRPTHPVGRVPIRQPPTIMLQGVLTRPTNSDAARFLVDRVLPSVRDRVPHAAVRLVGSVSPDAQRLGSGPGVSFSGWVPSIAAELARADLVATPIRFGSGTRIKILEAFAHRIPVVSTSLGAYGLDVSDGQHLLLADDEEAFADACVTLLTDQGKRRALADDAEALFVQKYQWCDIADSIRNLALSVAKRVATSSDG